MCGSDPAGRGGGLGLVADHDDDVVVGIGDLRASGLDWGF